MRSFVLAAVLLLSACGRNAEEAAPAPTSPSSDGAFFAVETKADDGKVLATLPAPDEDGVLLRAIYTAGLTAGLGSNPVGLDRGSGGASRVVVFRRIGKKVVLEEENWRYRASADNPLEKASVRNSFARSFLWATEIVETRGDGSVVVDLAAFLSSDILDLKGSLKSAGQEGYSLVADRSFPDYSSVLVFPDNVEIDAFVTFASEKAGSEVEATAADGRAFTLVQHHSFVRLPPEGFETRDFDPRVGAIDVPYYDFSAPLSGAILRSYARRFRLEREEPAAEKGPVKKPIVFYVDSGAPEPVRSALVEGASWWAEAFEAAGFEDAFRVDLLPEGVHPMDIRYNIITWAHRQTRGWSYGGGVYDPRTGEMLKAMVVLGSQRVRQDRMIFEGLAGVGKTGTGAADDPVELALARVRQLSAHEVGHTLGFAHNFAASVNDRASVMDYPAPLVRVNSGALDFSGAYDVGIGEWDKVAARWLYGEFQGDERAALDQIIEDAYAAGLKFIDDSQGRSIGAAHPAGSVWDNGSDPVAMLDETMEVRRIALARFGAASLKDRQPTSDLNQIIVPVYLYHRYQVAAAAKLIGGDDFRYAVKGDGDAPGAAVPVERQRAALTAILATLDPAALDLPDATLDRLTPALASFGARGGAEVFERDTGAMFDLLSAADAAATEALGALLHPARLARLVEMERRDPQALTVAAMLDAIERAAFATSGSDRRAEIARTVQSRFLSMLMERAADANANAAVAARIDAYLRALRGRISVGPIEERAHRAFLIARLDAHFARPAPPAAPTVADAEVPPGPPIGSLGEDCWFCDLN